MGYSPVLRLLGTNGTAFTSAFLKAITINEVTGAVIIGSGGLAVTGTLTSSSGAGVSGAYGSLVGLGNSGSFPTLTSGKGTAYGNATLGLVLAGNGSANAVTITSSGGTIIAGFSSTGLAVTGGIEMANNYSFSVKDSGGTARRVIVKGPDDQTYIGDIDNTTTAAVWVRAKSTLYSAINGTAITTISSTGLAVTGTLSATERLYAGTTSDVSARIHIAWPGVGDGSTAIGASFRTSNTGTSVAIQFVNTDGAPSQVGTITQSTTATAYNTSSDARLKTNVRNILNSGAIIDALNPCLFDWKSGVKDSYGFIAQEVYPVFAQAVTKGDDGEEIKEQWQIDQSKLIPVLTAEIKSLRRRVAELEGINHG